MGETAHSQAITVPCAGSLVLPAGLVLCVVRHLEQGAGVSVRGGHEFRKALCTGWWAASGEVFLRKSPEGGGCSRGRNHGKQGEGWAGKCGTSGETPKQARTPTECGERGEE